MDSFNEGHQSSSFMYNPNLNMANHAADDDNEEEDEAGEFSGVLEIFVHHARNIHNICIYDNQDVYAKFSFTYNPDETLSTRIINGGGKNPTFNENLRMKISNIDDAVLKCEIWMFSRARNHLEDQLLGFSLVPISQVLIGKGKGKVTQDYSLSSTDLFHSPAGTVQLTLSLDTNNSNFDLISSESAKTSSISSEVVLLDRKVTEVMVDPVEYSRIVFPDIGVAKENQEMATEYFNFCSSRGLLLPFLRLGATNDCEMNPVSPNESIHQNSGFLSSTTTSLSDDRDRNSSVDSIQKKNNSCNVSISVIEGSVSNSPDTPTSKKEGESMDEKESEKSDDSEKKVGKFGQVFSAPLGNMNMNMNLEAEQSAMQKQIVDMYMRSMQQFTESLARMKLPMEIDKSERKDQDCGDVIQNHESSNNNNIISEIDDVSNNSKKKKDGSRVFYGSRAFF
ncbi:hypothetical protein HN873_058324 [Arachis hypogaea]|nr:uncharacterized protein DS421_17g572750 [Arachis hypogaea]